MCHPTSIRGASSALVLGPCLLGLILAGSPALSAQVRVENGDVNGDGQTDISDVVALAGFLYLGGTPPVPASSDCPGEIVEPPSSFEAQFYKSLDIQAAAKEQFGFLAVAVATGDHAYDWKAQVGREQNGLDLKRAVANQYGPEYSLVMTGVHKFDWKAFRFAEPDRYVLPVMLIASDFTFDIDGVAEAVTRYRTVLGRVQGFYNARVDGVLHFLQPLVLPTSLTSAQWNALSAQTAQDADRYVLLNQTIQSYEQQLPPPADNLRVVLSIYTGDSQDIWLGAASTGKYSMGPPRATSLGCPAAGSLDANCSDAAYAIGHELGHTLGLGHTCDEFPEHADCGQSIMQTGHPPEAILLQREIVILIESGFFHESS